MTEEEMEKERKAQEKFWEKFRKQQQRERDRRDMDAYMAGRKAAEDISLADKLG